MALPREVVSYAAVIVRRVGLNLDDALSIAGEQWAAQPDNPQTWKVIAYRRAVDLRREREGRHGQRRDPLWTDLEDPAWGDAFACDEHGYTEVDLRDELSRRLATLTDDDLGALARVYWLNQKWPTGADAACLIRALRHARTRQEQPHAPTLPGSRPRSPLSQRETRIVALVADGRSNKEIAATAHVSTNTVKTHLARITAKLGARDRAHIAAIALRSNWID